MRAHHDEGLWKGGTAEMRRPGWGSLSDLDLVYGGLLAQIMRVRPSGRSCGRLRGRRPHHMLWRGLRQDGEADQSTVHSTGSVHLPKHLNLPR